MTAVSREWITQSVRRTRAEQGLPPTVTDPVVLDRVADLIGPALDDKAAQRPHEAA